VSILRVSKTSLQKSKAWKIFGEGIRTSWITRDLVRWRMAEGLECQMEWSGGRSCVE
jgi:hypothetical protein